MAKKNRNQQMKNIKISVPADKAEQIKESAKNAFDDEMAGFTNMRFGLDTLYDGKTYTKGEIYAVEDRLVDRWLKRGCVIVEDGSVVEDQDLGDDDKKEEDDSDMGSDDL